MQLKEDTAAIQSILDPLSVGLVTINPESRVKVEAGKGNARLQQSGYVPWLIKVINQGSTMDTARIAEWNLWYHVLNCGFPLKASGETDFPCMSGNAVGQGRGYVQLGKVDQIDFAAWCKG